MAYNIYEEAVSELFKSMKVVMYLPAVLYHSKPLRLLSNNLALLKTLPAVEYKGSIEYDEKK